MRTVFSFVAVVAAAAAFVVAPCAAELEVKKSAALVGNNRWEVSVSWRGVPAGRDVGVQDALPAEMELAEGSLVTRVNSAAGIAGENEWHAHHYVAEARHVRFTIANRTVAVALPPAKVSVFAAKSDDVAESAETNPVDVVAELTLFKGTRFAQWWVQYVVGGAVLAAPALVAMLAIALCSQPAKKKTA